MKLYDKQLNHRQWLLILATFLTVYGCAAPVAEKVVEPEISTPVESSPMDLLGEWCREKKRRITKYTVKEGNLRIRSGRSGQLFEVDLTCDEGFTVCEAKTIRGWGTPVTEILRLDGEQMKLTRIWGGAWNDKTYNFTYIRCPKW